MLGKETQSDEAQAQVGEKSFPEVYRNPIRIWIKRSFF